MRGVPHALIGASVGVVLAGGVGREAWPVVAIAAGSALLPDLDVPSSTASGLFRGASGFAGLTVGVGSMAAALERSHDPTLAIAVGCIAWLAVLFITSRLAPWRYLEHRGPFHSIPAAVAGGLLAWGATQRSDVAIAVLAGWLSHLVADGPTYMGLPLFWPISSRLVHLTPWALRFRSGSWLEWPLSLACVLASSLMVALR